MVYMFYQEVGVRSGWLGGSVVSEGFEGVTILLLFYLPFLNEIE